MGSNQEIQDAATFFNSFTKKHTQSGHSLHGSAECCNGHQPLGLKMRISGCPETRTPTSGSKCGFAPVITLGTGKTPANFWLWGVTLLPPSNTQSCHRMSLFKFYVFFFGGVLLTCTGQTPEPILDRSWVKRRGFHARKCFGGLKL